jgi:hypothetical protein
MVKLGDSPPAPAPPRPRAPDARTRQQPPGRRRTRRAFSRRPCLFCVENPCLNIRGNAPPQPSRRRRSPSCPSSDPTRCAARGARSSPESIQQIARGSVGCGHRLDCTAGTHGPVAAAKQMCASKAGGNHSTGWQLQMLIFPS